MPSLVFINVELEMQVSEYQMRELNDLVETQGSTHKNHPGNYYFYMHEGKYDITIDDDYNVIVNDIIGY